ncbi:L(3)82Fd [Strongyloides ratti]|uniref:L(3)82Fd n=1 Tax=Strongyloides ratti TaxID=34506 RepID=A0A090L815_STRRB|nr:L(3)82Fd [Strongyloides ratti]CEF64233.1 L(3)82Fd [Strongyloides ratti]
MEYEVKSTDTLASIAAAHDCTISELIKLNKLPTRMVFSGQIIRVPISGQQIQFTSNSNRGNVNMSTKENLTRKASGGPTLQPRSFSINETASSDGIRKGPGGVIPVQAAKYANQNPLAKTQSVPVTSKISDPSNEFEDDTDCLQRFLKIKVKHVTESDGTVTGTLLVTPNCLMFDPDLSHPLVKENSQDLYGMIANMEDINSVAVFNDIRDLTGENPPESRKLDLFDPDHKKTPVNENTTILDSVTVNNDSQEKTVPLKFTLESTTDTSDNEDTHSSRDTTNLNNSNAQLQIIEEEDTEHKNERLLVPQKDKPRTVSDITNDKSEVFDECFFNKSTDSSNSSTNHGNIKRQRANSERQSSSSLNSETGTTFSRFSPNMARRSFGKLGRTLSQRASSLKDSVQSAGQTVAAGTRTVAHGVVQHTKSAADQLQTGLQTSAKIVATAPSNIVQKGSELVKDTQNMFDSILNIESQEPKKTEKEMRREQSLAKLETLAQKTEEARKNITKLPTTQFICGTTIEEKPELFKSFNSFSSYSSILSSGNEDSSLPQEPYYMIVRLNRKTTSKNKKGIKKFPTQLDYFDDDGSNFGNKRKKEFWFAVPRQKADSIYHFLLQWSPDKYGHDLNDESEDKPKNYNGDLKSTLNQRGFLILNRETDDAYSGKFN